MSSTDPCRCDESIEYRGVLMSVAKWLQATHRQAAFSGCNSDAIDEQFASIQDVLESWWQNGDPLIPSIKGE